MKTILHLNTKQTMFEPQRIASKDIPYALAQGLNGEVKASGIRSSQSDRVSFTIPIFTRNAVTFTPVTKYY
ncbi:unnamed protein product [Commensalibacter communis]|uniref:Uncharacterized protein n=1 Tax=Commensalibacter communis TaxID=2972786 RepID=A0A9W4TRN8_9PROT|nr:unnamed protein product [Commensalibacter communis]CAI3958666.1 unnamed protein product [Commensalibacter communis]CAI3959859.1 unnamed protein product [Commensalibacter communis]CAI3960468.1 unnamed protein product [Commensalibacter communis]CAI3960501.1 unnamed protein product [Commensalibacter communis]